MSLSETDDPIEMIRQSGADPQVLGRIWEHYRDRLRRVVRLRLDRVGRDNGKVATGSLDGTAQLWDAGTGMAHGPPLVHHGPVRSLHFSPDGTLLLTGSNDKTARLWD